MFRSSTDLISLLILLLLLLGQPLQKSLRLHHSNRTWVNFGRNVLQVNMHRLTESDFWFGIIISRRQPWHHFIHNVAAWRENMKCLSTWVYPWSVVHWCLFKNWVLFHCWFVCSSGWEQDWYAFRCDSARVQESRVFWRLSAWRQEKGDFYL